MKTINAFQLSRELTRSDAVVVDVLPRENYEDGHVPGAVSVPFEDEGFVPGVRQAVDSLDQKVIVYCAKKACDLSTKAAQELEANGFGNVVDFEGGIDEWKQSGLPIEGGPMAENE
jgi:rhodanese-related sulfurtransferase